MATPHVRAGHLVSGEAFGNRRLAPVAQWWQPECISGPFMNIIAKIRLLGLLAARGLLVRPSKPASLSRRLSAMPYEDLPLHRPVSIRWNNHQVPYVDADHDEDLAFCFGLVHAHLRLGQIELLRRVAYGRLAELGGAILLPVDHMLRALDFPRATRAMLQAMPESTLAWLGAYVNGLNTYISRLEELPHELVLLGMAAEPWRIEDVAALGRLSAIDSNWPVWMQLLRHREDPEWPSIWSALTEGDWSTAALPEMAQEAEAVIQLATGIARTGSNALAISGGLTATGKPLLAADPHLPLTLPSTWLLAGGRSPSFHAVGLMIPGLPFIASGRNPWIAWGGTSMHAATSDLVDVAGLAPQELHTRTETINVRWSRPRRISIRETRYGPIISDCQILPTRRALALRWQGHWASDEFTAMLRVNRARDWRDFTTALEHYAVPGLNMVYADVAGNVGQTMAVKLPLRPNGLHPDIIVPSPVASDWRGVATSRNLPRIFNPKQGYVVSANDRPLEAAMPVGHFFSANDRLTRMQELIHQCRPVKASDIVRFHQDVTVTSALACRNVLVRAGSLIETLSSEQQLILDILGPWDGRYAAESRAALAFELLVHRFAVRFYRGTAKLAAYRAMWNAHELLRYDIDAADGASLTEAIGQGLTEAAQGLRRYRSWGGMHRLELNHLFTAIPLIGSRYRFADLPASGSTETLMKTAHPSTDHRHAAIYGANARQICDLSDLDASSFVLLGGEDGWLGSSTFIDQLELWRQGRYIAMPMRPESIARHFPILQELRPAAGQIGQ